MPSNRTAAVFWDESYLWGLVAVRALRQKGLRFDLVTAGDIRSGALEGRRLLFVPGGWASNKLKALGDGGTAEIRRFVREGGSYLGFCGGAGLATQDGLGLLLVERVPTEHRVPSFSGPIACSVDDDPIWDNIYRPVFHAWWPSQFSIADADVRILARYGRALPDAYSSDIQVGSVMSDDEWATHEAAYGIHLNPARLEGEPAVVEGRYGRGRVLLSLLHFDTPDDGRGNRVLRKLWADLGGQCRHDAPEPDMRSRFSQHGAPLVNEARILIAAGESLGLWQWRTPWVLSWKRGVRGLEYCTLANMAAAVSEQLNVCFGDTVPEDIAAQTADAAHFLALFRLRAEELLRREEAAMRLEPIAYNRCKDPETRAVRTALFGDAKSYGGEFKATLDRIDGLLYALLKRRRT